VDPRATYRVQLGAGLGFDGAAELAPYLERLGVSHLYASPCLQAAAGSTHGYDVVDHSRLSEDLGGERAFARLTAALRRAGLGLVLDVVPNHMARDGRANRWWWDVLENGPASPFAPFFDVDWTAGGARGASRVLVPVLEERLGSVLVAGDVSLRREGGSFVAAYGATELPLSPTSVAPLLSGAALAAGSPKLGELAASLGTLADVDAVAPDLVAERHEEQGRLVSDLAAICDAEEAVALAIDAALARVAADPHALDALLQGQHYRLAHHRVAEEELDYRRFLNIGELVALRVESPRVFDAVHELVVDLVRRGEVQGLRVDHVDGLLDPEGYLRRLRDAAPDAYLVVEKVLADAEPVRTSWPVDGTTGYDFLAVANGLFVQPDSEAAFLELYEEFLGEAVRYPEVLHTAKLEVVAREFSSELERLVSALAEACDRCLEQRDRTRGDLRTAVVELLASFAVYRTYVAVGRDPEPEDRDEVAAAIERAGAWDVDADLLGFLGELLLLERPGEPETAFALGFQQLCAAVAAKGVEDTAFYRFVRLCSLDEVGCDPALFGTSPARFHEFAAGVAAIRPTAMLTLETHDTKRSADVRARLNALSEQPAAWRSLLAELDEASAPYRPALLDRTTEYLVAQTLVGAWPIPVERAVEYVRKATKEAKVATSWDRPNEAYDTAVEGFVRTALADERYAEAVEAFLAATDLVAHGRRNSIAQLALLLTAPGVPDLYQGTELWQLALVDPDNRRPVDFARRAALLDELAGEGPPRVSLADDEEGRTKLWLTATLLTHRREHPERYRSSSYAALEASGPAADRVVAFARDGLVTCVPRLAVPADGLDSTLLALPPGGWRDLLTGAHRDGEVAVATLFEGFPVTVLERVADR